MNYRAMAPIVMHHLKTWLYGFMLITLLSYVERFVEYLEKTVDFSVHGPFSFVLLFIVPFLLMRIAQGFSAALAKDPTTIS